MACISENITESPEFKKLVDKIGLSETVRDYLENNKIRPLEEIKISKPELFKLDDTNELSKNNKVLDELPNEDWKNINNESDNPLDCI